MPLWIDKLFFLILCNLLAHTILAQQPAGRFINENDGIPSREVYSILEDKKGFIWIGCEAGLYKYNGVKFEYFAPPFLQSKEISGLTQNKQGDIFAYNFSGQILKTDGKTTQNLPPISQDKMSGFPNIFADHKGNIWATQQKILRKFDESKNNWEKTIYEKNTEIATRIMLAHQNQTYLINSAGVFELQEKKLIQYPIEWQKNDDTNLVSYTLAILNGKVALVHLFGKAVFVLENGKFVSFKNTFLLKAIQNRKINAVKQLKNGEVWFLTYTGIVSYHFQTNQVKEYYKDVAFSNILEDQRSQLWLTTLNQGILLIPNQSLLWFPTDVLGFEESHINHIAYLQAEESVYFSFLNGHIGSLSTQDFKFQSFDTGFQGDINLFEVHQNQLYYNIRDTLFRKNSQEVKLLVYGLLTPKTMFATQNQIFIGSSLGLYVLKAFNLTENHIFLANEKLCEHWVKDIFWDAETALLWVSTSKGVLVFERKNEKYNLKKHLFPNLYFRKIGRVEGLGLVAVSVAGEIYDLEHQKILYQNTKNYSLLVYSATTTSKQVILATNQGIYLYQANKQMLQISKWEGLINEEVYQTCIAKNHIWAATSNGIFVIPLSVFKNNTWIAPTVFIKSIQVDSTVISQQTEIHLAYYQKLKIELEASAMASGKDYHLFYRIDRGKWEVLNPENPFINLNNLPKGNFRITIKAEDHRKVTSSNAIVLKIFVQAPFWETWWFYFFLVVLGGFLVGLILQNRFKRLQKQQQIQAERLRLEQDLRISRLTALKAQMKPHFIFNVLNSIQSFIYQNNPKTATDYLGKFSKFMRLILAHSDKEYINLADELGMIRNYVDLEAMQLEGDFAYEVQIDDTLQVSDLFVPSFLLQAVVENVFKHAFKNKKDTKRLLIQVQLLSNEFFNIIIQDNGIGRENANINKQKIPQMHTSFASNAITQKIALLNTQSPESIVFSIVDLKDAAGNPTGTQVNLQVKIKENGI